MNEKPSLKVSDRNEVQGLHLRPRDLYSPYHGKNSQQNDIQFGGPLVNNLATYLQNVYLLLNPEHFHKTNSYRYVSYNNFIT